VSDQAVDLSCRELVELVTEYLEHRMPVEERSRFEIHLTYCQACRTYLAQIRETIAAAGRVTEESLPAASRDALLAAFRGWKRDPEGSP
jgi:anti-sigma factor RsiW